MNNILEGYMHYLDYQTYYRIAKSEKQNIEVKAANGGCPKRLYDTLSSFLIKMVVAPLCLV